jgi:hypothetical protein
MVSLIQTLLNLSRDVCSRCRSIWTVHLATNLEAPGLFPTPLGPIGALAVVRLTKKPQYESISSLHPSLLHLHFPHLLLHLHFYSSPIHAMPWAPCIIVVDNTPWGLDGFGHPPICVWYQLALGSVSVLFILGNSSFQHMSYFGRSHFNASKFWWLGVAPGPQVMLFATWG